MKAPVYPGSNDIVTDRSISRVISQIVRLPRQAQLRILTPVIHSGGKARGDIFRGVGGTKFMQIRISNRACSLRRIPTLSGGGGRVIGIIISQVVVGRNVHSHLFSSFRTTLHLDSNCTATSIVNNRPLVFSRRCTYPVYNFAINRLRPQLFSFGTPLKTYPRYRKLNDGLRVSRRLIIPSQGGALHRKTVLP